MARPDDIPQDVWEAADAVLVGNEWNPHRTERIARAIMAERYRCARVASSFVKLHDTGHGIAIDPRADASAIAKAIREGHQ